MPTTFPTITFPPPVDNGALITEAIKEGVEGLQEAIGAKSVGKALLASGVNRDIALALINNVGSVKSFSLVNRSGTLEYTIGGKEVKFGNDIEIEDKNYSPTKGLLSLLTNTNADPTTTAEDVKNYREILVNSGAINDRMPYANGTKFDVVKAILKDIAEGNGISGDGFVDIALTLLLAVPI